MAPMALVALVALVAANATAALGSAGTTPASGSAAANPGSASGTGSTAAATPMVTWADDLTVALERAEKTGKPVLIDFYADWCSPCHVMEREIYAHPDSQPALGAFVPLKIDADANESLAIVHRVTMLPTTVVLDASGREIANLPGLPERQSFLGWLDAVARGYGTYLEDSPKADDTDALERTANYFMDIGNARGATRALKAGLALAARGGAERARVDKLRLKLAQAQFVEGDVRGSVALFEELVKHAEAPDVRGWALAGLMGVQDQLGRRQERDASMERLREEFPEIAEVLGLL